MSRNLVILSLLVLMILMIAVNGDDDGDKVKGKRGGKFMKKGWEAMIGLCMNCTGADTVRAEYNKCVGEAGFADLAKAAATPGKGCYKSLRGAMGEAKQQGDKKKALDCYNVASKDTTFMGCVAAEKKKLNDARVGMFAFGGLCVSTCAGAESVITTYQDCVTKAGFSDSVKAISTSQTCPKDVQPKQQGTDTKPVMACFKTAISDNTFKACVKDAKKKFMDKMGKKRRNKE